MQGKPGREESDTRTPGFVLLGHKLLRKVHPVSPDLRYNAT